MNKKKTAELKKMIITAEVRKDVHRYGVANNYGAVLKIIALNPGARYMFLYRMCNKYKKRTLLGFLFRIWIKLLADKKNVEIPHKTQIFPGLYFGHFKNIIINQNSKIGENCNIMQGVTIGNESRGTRRGSPTIGDRVVIGPNSVIVGKISIGNDVLIGPLTFVNFDVPDNSVVIGNPAKIINSKGSAGYIKRI